jgi:hypothetical protein
LDHVYLDLLGRPRDPGSQGFLEALNRGTPRPAIVALIQTSQEYDTRLVTTTYAALLNRPASPGEASLWFGLLNAAPVAGQPSPVEQFTTDVLASAEYFQKHGNSSLGWVDSLYRTFLGRPPDSAGYQGALAAVLNAYAALRQDVGVTMTSSSEYHTALVAGYYMQFLKRAGSPDELSRWVGILQAGGTDEGVLAGIVSSLEYFGKAGGTNQQWLDQIYQDLLGRSRDPNDLVFINALNSGATRVQIAGIFLASQEYQRRLIQSMYMDYLARPGSDADLNFWLPALAGSRDEVVRAEILSSSEYFLRPHSYP